MKRLRRAIKLLPPAFAMRIWLAKRYGISVAPAPGGAFLGALLAILPFAFTATLSVRKESDIRLVKFFVPYGKMKGFLRRQHRMEVGDAAKDSGISGAIRFVMPYGLVLWWDAEDDRLRNGSWQGARSSAAVKHDVAMAKVRRYRLSDKDRQEYARMDEIGAMTLRLMIIQGAAVPSSSDAGNSAAKQSTT